MIYLFHERHVTLIFDANKSNSLVFSERDSGFKMPINPIFCSFQKGILDSKCQSIQFSVLFRKGFWIQNASLGKEEIIITILIEKKKEKRKKETKVNSSKLQVPDLKTSHWLFCSLWRFSRYEFSWYIQ